MSEEAQDDDEDTTRRSLAELSEEQMISPDVLEVDHVYSALAHPRRRYLCYTLMEDTEWSLTELARKIAAWENDISEDDVTDDQRDDVYISLTFRNWSARRWLHTTGSANKFRQGNTQNKSCKHSTDWGCRSIATKRNTHEREEKNDRDP